MDDQFRPIAMPQNGSGPDHWQPESDRDALVPNSSLQIEDGLIESLNRKRRRGGASKWVLAGLIGLVAILSLACVCLSVSVWYLLHFPGASDNLLAGHQGVLPWSVYTTADAAMAANASLPTSTFPIPVDFSRQVCSNNGIQYARQQCSCFACFTGAQCETRVADDKCTVDANSGTPLLFEEYWTDHPVAETRVRASENIGYQTSHLPRLEAAVRAIHAMVGNAVTEGKHIVFGAGSTEVISTALYAYASLNTSSGPLEVYSKAPFYNAYKIQTSMPESRLFSWSESPPNGSQPVLEFITSPNNPDGTLRSQSVPGSMAIYDHAYYWPHFTPITGPVDYNSTDIAVFTLSKLSGHASSRIGWAIVSDAKLAEALRRPTINVMSIESQIRATVILEHILGTQGELFGWAGQRMASRWQRLQSIFSTTRRFAAQDLESAQKDSWTSSTRSSSPAYLWMKCTDSQRDANCTAAVEAAGILGREGSAFGGDSEHVRLELLMRQEDFELMADKLQHAAGQ